MSKIPFRLSCSFPTSAVDKIHGTLRYFETHGFETKQTTENGTVKIYYRKEVKSDEP